MKKILILLIMIFSLTGCKDYIEINDLAILTGIVIDYTDDMYEVTAQLIVNDKKSNTKVFTTKSSSINEAIAELSKLSNKEVFISHLKVLIVTDNIIKNNIDFKDYFLRSSKSKMNFYVYVINEDIKDKVLNIYKENDGSSIYLEKMMKFNQNIFSSSTPLKFTEYAYYTLEKGYTNIYPKIDIVKNNDKEVLYLSNLTTFKDDKEFELSENESIFYNILTNKANKSSLTINCDENTFSIEIQDIKTKFKLNDNKIYINNKSKTKIVDYKCKYDLNKKETIEKLINLTNNYIEANINDFLKFIKKNDTDIIGIGNYIYKHKLKSYNKEYLSNINFEVKSNTNITSVGEIKR
ncbi:MAG: Ger(x)C family spore germination protein [Bacilli bacterium]|nr:Ger(x)C family spore germination protein [Bacilli bacterium]